MVRIIPYEWYVYVPYFLGTGKVRWYITHSRPFYCQMIKPLNVKKVMTCVIKRQSKLIIV